MKKILFTGDTLTEVQRAEYRASGFEIVPASYDLSTDRVTELLKDCDGYILGGDEIADANMLASVGDKLKAISFFGAGYEKYIDVVAAKKKGIAVANTPGANADSVAEFTVAIMQSIIKEIPSNNASVKRGEWSRPKTFDLKGKTVGIIGLGNIGARVAKILSLGFGANVIYTSRKEKKDLDLALNTRMVSLDELLTQSDAISIHASLTDDTRGMISTSEFDKMKQGVVIVDTARVEIIDESALLDALKSGKVSKCAFDGFYEEPVNSAVVSRHELLALNDSRFIVTPHMAYYTSDALKRMERMAIENVIQILTGKDCPYLVN